jgi:hypothetical protein
MSDVTDYRVQRIKNEAASSERLVALLAEFAKTVGPDDAPHITALRKALAATIVHIRELEKSGQTYDPSINLMDLWWQAGDALQAKDATLADACRDKAFGWVDPEAWKIAEQEGKRISIKDMKDALKRLVGEHLANAQEAKALRPETTDITRIMPTWMMDEKKTKAVAFLGTGIAVVVAGLWAVFVFSTDKSSKAADAGKQSTPGITINNNPTINPQINQNVTVAPAPSPGPSMKVEVTHEICVGEYESRCPKGKYTDYASCGMLDDAAVKLCNGLYNKFAQQSYPGNKCGYTVVKVVCTASK